MRKHAFEDGDVVKLESGAVGIYSGEDWLGLAAPPGRVWVVIDGDVAAVDPAEINKFGGRSAMRTEAEIVRDLQQAEGLQEERELVRELELFRQGRTAAVQADLEIDISNAFIRDTLTPVLPYMHHTSATDWIEEEATSGPYDHTMRVEATMWFGRVSAEVKEDREEFAEQAQGMARRVSGQFGLQAEAAYHAFLETVARLHRQADDKKCQFCGVTLHGEPPYGNCLSNPDGSTHQASLRQGGEDSADSTCKHCGKGIDYVAGEYWATHDGEEESCPDSPDGNHHEAKEARRRTADDKPGQVDDDQSGNAESAVTDYDTKDDQEPFLGEDWEDPEHAGVHPAMPGAGEGSRENEPRPEKESSFQKQADVRCANCGHEFWDHLAVPGPPLGMVGRCRFGDCDQFTNEDTIEAGASLRKQARPLYEIADEIRRDWTKVYFGAVPYLDAMSSLDSISEPYGYDSGESIVAYFLSNASTWRGDKAREIKAELNKMLKGGSLQKRADTCSKCGDSIEKDPSGEDPQTYHHNNGEKHDHEATPSSNGESKESRRRKQAGMTTGYYFLQLHPRDLGISNEEYEAQYGVPYTGWSGEEGGMYASEDAAKADRPRVEAEHGKVLLMSRMVVDTIDFLQALDQGKFGSRRTAILIGVRPEYDEAGNDRGDLTLWSGGFMSDFEGWADPIEGGYHIKLEYGGEVDVATPLRNDRNHFQVDETINQAVNALKAQGSRRTAGVYCKTHDVWVGDGNADTHEGCEKEQRATEKTKDARRTAAGDPIAGIPQQYVVIDTAFGVVLSGPLSFDEAVAEMMAVGETYQPDEFGSINLGVDEYREMAEGEETGTSSYDHPSSWTYKGAPQRRASGPGKGRGGQDAPFRGVRTAENLYPNYSDVKLQWSMDQDGWGGFNDGPFYARVKEYSDRSIMKVFRRTDSEFDWDVHHDFAGPDTEVYGGNYADVDEAKDDASRWIAENARTGSRRTAAGYGQPGQSTMSVDYSKIRGYSHAPTKNVTVLPDTQHCSKCGKETRYEPGKDMYGFGGKHFHADGSESDHFVSPRTQCSYCHNDNPATVRYRQHAWYDSVECDRCGGIWGRGIGD